MHGGGGGFKIFFAFYLAILKFPLTFSIMNSNNPLAKVSALESTRHVPTADDLLESLSLSALVELLGGTITREYIPPFEKTYVLIYNGVKVAEVTYNQKSSWFYTGQMFQDGRWVNWATFGNAQAIEKDLF